MLKPIHQKVVTQGLNSQGLSSPRLSSLRGTNTAVVLSAMLALVCTAAKASDTQGTFTASFENDLFTTGNDDNYTHGTQFTYVSDTYLPRWGAKIASLLPFMESSDDQRAIFRMGQQIFTPKDIGREMLIENDRPYAGWLYISAGVLADSYKQSEIRHLDKLELILGTVGPDSGAENVQTEVHKLTDSKIPQGWDNQLDNEITYDLSYQHQWMIPLVNDTIDIVPQASVTLGSSQRNVGLGMAARIGSGLRSDFGPPLINVTGSGSGYFKPEQALYWYFYVGAYGHYVDYNIFLDGNTDGGSHSVDRNEWVGDLQAGFVVGAGNWRLAFASIVRTKTFAAQDANDQYGSMSVSYRF